MIIADADNFYTKAQTERLITEEVQEVVSDNCYNKDEVNSLVDDLETADSVISGAVDNVSSALTQEAQRAIDAESALANSIATKAASSALTEEIQRAQNAEGALSNEIATKANAVDVYTKVETDNLLNEKTDADSVYTKNETDSIVSDLETADSVISGAVDNVSSAVSQEAQRAIDAETALASQISTKANTSALTQETQRAEQAEGALANEIATKADASSVYNKTQIDTFVDELENADFQISGSVETNRLNILSISSGLTSETQRAQDVETVLAAEIATKADSSAVTQEISAAVSGKADSDSVYTKSETDTLLAEKADSSAVTEAISAAVSGKADSSAVTEAISAAVSGKVNTSAITSSVTSSSTNAEIPTAKAVYDAIGGGGSGISSAECQTMIDNSISGKADSSNVYTKTEVDSALSGKASTATTQTLSNTLGTHTADTNIHVTSQEKNTWNGKQDALSAGSGITITNNTVSAKIWSGTRTEWGQISGNTQADMLYLVYE